MEKPKGKYDSEYMWIGRSSIAKNLWPACSYCDAGGEFDEAPM
jgi:hypothetical protein